MADGGSVSIVENTGAARYEISVDGALAGFSTYRDRSGARVVLHTEVAPEFEGRGLGGELAQFVLDDIRSRGLQVVPRCPYIARYIKDHTEYADLVTR
jgi:predicted GNAT family acetyltransferase